jgi:hypothetical protein
MNQPTRAEQIAQELKAVGNAHFEYETTVLKGVYDDKWSEWYAEYLLAHDWNALFTRVWTAAELAATLRQLNTEHRARAAQTPWVEYYAERFAEMT